MLDAIMALNSNEYIWISSAVALVVLTYFALSNTEIKNAKGQNFLRGFPFGGGMGLMFLSMFLLSRFAPLLAISLYIYGAGLMLISLPLSGDRGKETILIFIPIMLFSFTMLGYFFLLSPYVDQKLLTQGEPALATIVSIKPTGTQVNDQPEVRLLLDVQPENGPTYQTEKKMVISTFYAHQFQPGAELKIKYDPRNRKRIVVQAVQVNKR